MSEEEKKMRELLAVALEECKKEHRKALVRARNEGLEKAAKRLIEHRDKPLVSKNPGRRLGLEEAASIVRAMMEPEE